MGAGSLDDLYAAIGYGGMTAQKAVNRIKDELLRLTRDKNEKAAAERLAAQAASPSSPPPPSSSPAPSAASRASSWRAWTTAW